MHRAFTVLVFLITAMTGQAVDHDAEKVLDNPPGVPYEAILPKAPFFKEAELDGNAKGSIYAVATDSGDGVRFKVKFSNLPKEGGPFTYHLHTRPVPEDGNCTDALGHLDPYGRGSETPCDAKDPASCEVGDLSGKWGKIERDPFEDEYVDQYASTKNGNSAFLGNRSFVLHFANKTRLSCANFHMRLPEKASASSSAPAYLPTPRDIVSANTHTHTPAKTSSSDCAGKHTSTPNASGTPVAANEASSMKWSLHMALIGVAALLFAL